MNQQTFNPHQACRNTPEPPHPETGNLPSRCIQQISDATLTQPLVQFLEKKQSAARRSVDSREREGHYMDNTALMV